ncbi:splicing factor [Tanacetum coccineum]
MVKSWLVQDQTVLGKDYSNLLIADSLLKTIWFINAPCYDNEALASPKANGCKDPFSLSGPSVSVNQCKMEKHRAVYDLEGVQLDVDTMDDGKTQFKRMYICFKVLKEGWTSCRRVIGLDGCFLKLACRGELLTAMGRDSNNKMFPMAWAVLTILSDGHKGLIKAVKELLLNDEHRLCTRHIYVNFKKKWNGLHYKSLFWGAETSTLELFEVRKADEGFGVNLNTKTCTCKRWNLSGIPCIHAVVAYCMLNQDPGIGVSSWYSKQMWVDAYSYFIKPVEKGHNRARCYNQTRPKPQQEKRKPGKKSQQATNQPFNPPNADPTFADPSADPSFADSSFTNPSALDPSYADPCFTDPSAADPNQSFTGLLNYVEQQRMDAEITALADMNEAEEREARRNDAMLKGFSRRQKRREFIEREVLVDGEDYLRG